MAEIKVYGLKKLNDRIQIIIENIGNIVPLIQSEAKVTKDQMQTDAPVDTGFLRDNITASNTEDGATIRSGAYYSGYVDRGTSRMSAQPFFRVNIFRFIMRIRRKLRRTLLM